MIEMHVAYDWEEEKAIGDFITERSDNGTLYQRPKFLHYHDQDKFLDTRRIQFSFYKNSRLVAHLAAALRDIPSGTHLISPFGSSYGGIVFDADLTFSCIETVYTLLMDFAKNNADTVQLGNSPGFHSRNGINSYMDHLLLANGFQIKKSDIIMVHELGASEVLRSRLDKKTLTELKQPLEKTKLQFEVKSGPDRDAYKLLVMSQQRLKTGPTHSFEELEEIERLIPGTVHSFKTYFDGNLVAGIIAFRVSQNILNTFYIFDTQEGRSLKANHFNYFQALEFAKRNGYRYLDFGATSFGFVPNHPLIAFKEKFDAKPFLRHTYSKQSRISA